MQNNQGTRIGLTFMEEISGSETEFYIAVTIIIVLFIAVCFLARFVTAFSRELRLLNIEISRTEGAEREHYIRERRRLWLSLLPFVHY